MVNSTREQREAALDLIQAIADTIRELGSVPSGHLYARLMDTISIETYNTVIRILVDANLVRLANHELTWIGKY